MDEKAIAEAFGYFLKAAMASAIGYIMHRIKKVEAKAEDSMSRPEIREMVEDMNKPLEVLQKELKEDTQKIDQKLDSHTQKIDQKLDKLLDHVLSDK